jgi:DUF917 family protein
VREIGADNLSDMARGAALLGSGGGGDPYIGRLMAQHAMAEHGPVTLMTADEVDDDALVVAVSMMGAPTVLVEKPPSGEEYRSTMAALSDFLGEPITHLACVEAGGVNSMIPFAAAATLGLPLIDADAMGRAFPELQMKLPGLVGIGTAPMALADEKGNVCLLQTVANMWSERLARNLTVEMGCSTATSQLIMRGRDVRRSMALGTLTLAERLGTEVRLAQEAHSDPVAAATKVLNGHLLFEGKVVDVFRLTSKGFGQGEARLAGLESCHGSIFDLDFRNEYLAARRDGSVVATTPDLIIVVDTLTGEPVNTEGLRFGLRVSVIGAPCDERWRTPAGLELVGPRYFGYDIDYRPFEVLAGR